MSRSLLARVIALIVITVVGVYYIAFEAVGVHLTNQPFTVHAVLPSAGGIYQDAYVTYRGVTVGRVSALHLERNRVVVDLAIDHGEKIPADVTANVRELTAAAEQYMDLVPTKSDPPYLTPGYTIPESRTSIPTSIGTLLDTLNSLVGSLSPSDLNTLTKAFATGLQDAGGDLHSIIADTSTLATALHAAIPGTERMIDAGNKVLSTFDATSGELQQFSANLNALTRQVAQSNADLVHLLQNGQEAGAQLSNFLNQTSNPTVSLIKNLSATTNVAYLREPAVKALFEVLPLFSSDIAETTSGGQIRFELMFNSANTVCPYTSTMAEPTSLVTTASLTGTCTTEAPDLLQRGADKAPPPQG